MKKITLGILLGLFISNNALAWNEDAFIFRAGAIHYNVNNNDNNFTTKPKSDLKLTTENSNNVYLSYQYMFTKGFGLEFSHSKIKSDLNSVSSSSGEESKIGSISATPLYLNLMFYPNLDTFDFKPFLGWGINRTKFKNVNLTDSASKDFTKISNKTSSGFSAHVGFDYLVQPNISLFVKAAYTDIDLESKFVDNSTSKLSIDPISFTMGIGYSF